MSHELRTNEENFLRECTACLPPCCCRCGQITQFHSRLTLDGVSGQDNRFPHRFYPPVNDMKNCLLFHHSYMSIIVTGITDSRNTIVGLLNFLSFLSFSFSSISFLFFLYFFLILLLC